MIHSQSNHFKHQTSRNVEEEAAVDEVVEAEDPVEDAVEAAEAVEAVVHRGERLSSCLFFP